MLNYLWAGMMVVALLYGTMTGQIVQVANGALDGAKEAINLCVTMAGVLSFWVGLTEIAREGGLVEKLAKAMEPLVSFLFPDIPREHEAREYISTNMIANFMGLGWAATPAGLCAMEELSKLEEERPTVGRETASNAMCTFLILNISSLQLIPVNLIAYRSQYGSVNPTAVVGPGILATLATTIVAIIYCKWKDKGIRKKSST